MASHRSLTPLHVNVARHQEVPIPSVDGSRAAKLLPFVLSIVAGSVDIIGFIGLDGLFTAHITGNLVVLAAHLVAGKSASLALVMSVPLFIVMLAVTRIFAGVLERYGIAPLRPLLFLQFVLLCGFLGICLVAAPDASAEAPAMLVASMLGVSAMAVQNALVQVSLHGVPATAVITTNIARFTTDVGTILLGAQPGEVVAARGRADRLWPSIAGFIIGCCAGAVCEARFGLRALALPAVLALIALAMAAKHNAAEARVAGLSVPDPDRQNRFGSL